MALIPSISTSINVKLDDSNYLNWHFQMDYLFAAGVYFVDEDIVILAVNGLLAKYNTFKCVIRGRESVISLKDFKSHLLAEEAIVDNSTIAPFMTAMVVNTGPSASKGSNFHTRGFSHTPGQSQFAIGGFKPYTGNKNKSKGRFNQGSRFYNAKPVFSTQTHVLPNSNPGLLVLKVILRTKPTGRILYKGLCSNELYPIHSFTPSTSQNIYSAKALLGQLVHYKSATKVPVWLEAMKEEVNALHAQGTCSLVPLPANKNLVGCKWIFKIKKHYDGSIARHKAWLIAKVFSQELGLDYGKTFSPVVKPTTIRLTLALAAHFNRPLRQLDVNNVFLHGILQEEAPRAWNKRFTWFFPSLGFSNIYSDSSLFVKHVGNEIVVLLLYVDDIIITGSASDAISQVINALTAEFDTKDLASLHYFLGIQITKTATGLFLSQTKYIQDLLVKYEMFDAKPCDTPCFPYNRCSKRMETLIQILNPPNAQSVLGKDKKRSSLSKLYFHSGGGLYPRNAQSRKLPLQVLNLHVNVVTHPKVIWEEEEVVVSSFWKIGVPKHGKLGYFYLAPLIGLLQSQIGKFHSVIFYGMAGGAYVGLGARYGAAAWDPQSHKGGVGWVIRDFVGLLHSSGGSRDMAALQECGKEGIQFTEIEIDAKTILHMINKKTGTDAYLEGMIHDIWNLAQTFRNVKFTYAHWKCNHAAHIVTSYVSKYGANMSSSGDSNPPNAQSVLGRDKKRSPLFQSSSHSGGGSYSPHAQSALGRDKKKSSSFQSSSQSGGGSYSPNTQSALGRDKKKFG
ncbi:hypothetical protein D8674_021626 [Pyrus ussuriensis x Pyrus communis]|uniref:Reverse transcriptase Ty1/copia-type domain-containing protein n=1 Tax=Pyrus ussuriensis x Pyrus communis TaxID=2448454 RepID=A0A5N5GI44_9ROSA|nr:hypothetical protein D8674_021626 [Pyrus ussuriensis x Pyrus communis]